MGLFSKLFRHKTPAPTKEEEAVPCLHVALVPQWDSASDIGKEDRASRFVCQGCAVEFTPDEARELRETEAARLKATLGS